MSPLSIAARRSLAACTSMFSFCDISAANFSALSGKVIDIRLFQLRQRRLERHQLRLALRARAEKADGLRARGRHILGANARYCAGADRTDECAVHDGNGYLGLGIVQHDHGRAARQAVLERILRTAADPLDAGHVEPSADVAGHGVDASRRLFSVGLRALHHDLAGQNIVTLVIKAEDLFQIVDGLVQRHAAAADHVLLG